MNSKLSTQAPQENSTSCLAVNDRLGTTPKPSRAICNSLNSSIARCVHVPVYGPPRGRDVPRMTHTPLGRWGSRAGIAGDSSPAIVSLLTADYKQPVGSGFSDAIRELFWRPWLCDTRLSTSIFDFDQVGSGRIFRSFCKNGKSLDLGGESTYKQRRSPACRIDWCASWARNYFRNDRIFAFASLHFLD